MTHDRSPILTSSVLTGFAAVLPPETVPYLLKLVGVFVLAVVAELGRQLVIKLREKK